MGAADPAPAAARAKRGLAGDSSALRPGPPSLGGRGVLPRWRMALNEGLGGAAPSYGLGTPA